MNIWKRIACARDDQPAELQAAVDRLAELAEWQARPLDAARLANLIALGYSADQAAMREYRYRLTVAVSFDYMPSHCVWSGHLIGQ